MTGSGYALPNDQCPRTNAQGMSNAQVPIGHWKLGIIWSLDIGHWAFKATVVALARCAASAQLRGRFLMISMSLKMLLSRAPCSLTHWAMAVIPSSSDVLGRLPNARSHLL